MNWFAIVRIVGAVALSIAAALVLLIAVELYSEVVHPSPPGASKSMEEMCLHVARYPHWVLATVVPMWGFTAYFSTWIARRMGNRWCAAIIGTLIVAAAMFNTAMLPYPAWFKFVMPVVVVAAVVYGSLAPRRAKPATKMNEAQ